MHLVPWKLTKEHFTGHADPGSTEEVTEPDRRGTRVMGWDPVGRERRVERCGMAAGPRL